MAQLRAAQERDLTEDRQRIVAREQDLTQLRAAREQDLTQLRAARERVLRRLRAVQEQAMTRDRQRLAAREPGPDVPELWRISEEEAAAILTELLSGSEDYRQCNLCHTLESFSCMACAAARDTETLFAKAVIGVLLERGKHGVHFVEQHPLDEDAYKVFTSLTTPVAAKIFGIGLSHS